MEISQVSWSQDSCSANETAQRFNALREAEGEGSVKIKRKKNETV